MKILTTKQKLSQRKENLHSKIKILTMKEKFSQRKKNSHRKMKILTAKESFPDQTSKNPGWEISHKYLYSSSSMRIILHCSYKRS